MIDLSFQDKNGLDLINIGLGSVRRGRQTITTTFKLYNTGDATIHNVHVYPTLSENQIGSGLETYNACNLSIDNHNFQPEIYLTIPPATSKEFYLKWRPPITSQPGNKQWRLAWDIGLGTNEPDYGY
jgi:hypothetical protein